MILVYIIIVVVLATSLSRYQTKAELVERCVAARLAQSGEYFAYRASALPTELTGPPHIFPPILLKFSTVTSPRNTHVSRDREPSTNQRGTELARAL
ncbi:hypothetical protein DPMN_095899 [Dreissena polymorpha]|uniref:Secreted protein n=1 Tax=Dreissena polymorpha TaxID=45954 RepID=A0A9D4LA71_DREPO|nr:hypothetical protein DPMN_095899 [Dreissena polymorpha]